jgi:predicted regulator of Ras-like GTPase activity (Roadblock/LC7/MglB family)
MIFLEVLKGICERVQGAFGAMVIAEDGIVVERHLVVPEIDLELAGVEFAAGSQEFKRATAELKAGDLEEIMVVNRKSATMIRAVGTGYYLMLIMDAAGVLGRGRFELKKASYELADEFV